MNSGINVGLQESMNHSNQYVAFPLYVYSHLWCPLTHQVVLVWFKILML